MNIADKIKAVRRAKGITPTIMARELGIEATNYPRLENRGNQLTYNNIEKISSALGLTVIELLTWDEGQQAATTSDENIDRLIARIKELEKQVELYDENRSLKSKELESTRFWFSYLLDNVIWDIAYNYDIMSSEEAKEYGVLLDEDLRLWMGEDYWEVKDEHPYAIDTLREEQLKQALDILFSLVWVRDIIEKELTMEWFRLKLREWLNDGSTPSIFDSSSLYKYQTFYTYKGDTPELRTK